MNGNLCVALLTLCILALELETLDTDIFRSVRLWKPLSGRVSCSIRTYQTYELKRNYGS